MKPFRSEVVADPMARLRQIGAREQKQYATGTERIFFSKKHNCWAKLTADRRGFRLQYYRGCPC